MNEIITPQVRKDHGKAIIIAVTTVFMTCILSCAVVLIILIMRMA